MPRRRRGREAEPDGGVDADEEPRYRSAWGLDPAQWRPVGSMSAVGDRAVLLWRLSTESSSDVALRARRAYDRLGELGVTLAADMTPEGIEVTLPMARAALALRILADRSILPDAVLVGAVAADQLRIFRRDVAGYRGRVELVIGHTGSPDPITALQSRMRAG